MTTTFTAACVCFAPAQIISGVVLLVASLFLYLWDQRMLRREATPPEPQGGAG